MFIVFAKVDDTKHTAFIVETKWPGVSTGAEEKKMGIKGSSTRSVYFDNVQVPVENVLGEVGKGHKIAFNILNIGRLKLGAGTAVGAKRALNLALAYANERKAFGRPLSRLRPDQEEARRHGLRGLRRRVAGLSHRGQCRGGARLDAGDDKQAQLKAIEEYAIECSIAKVFGSEALALCVDEGVQIFGGYGFMEEYPIARPIATRASTASSRAPTRSTAWSPLARSSAARWGAAST